MSLGRDQTADRIMDDLKQQFLDTLLLTTDQIEVRFRNLLGANKSEGAQAVTRAFNIFHHDTWPKERQALLQSGYNELKPLTDWFQTVLATAGCEVEKIAAEWRSLKKTVRNSFSDKSYLEVYQLLLEKEPYKTDLANIRHLVEILLVLPISSLDCERAFSAQKRIKTSTRSCLKTSRLSDLILVSSEGPDLATFDPSSAIESWRDSVKTCRHPLAKDWNEDDIVTASSV